MRFIDGHHAESAVRFAGQGNSTHSEESEHGFLNAESIEFIAKPGKSEQLRAYLRDHVTPLLQKRAGFINTILLTSHSEPRRLVAISFWSTSEQAERAMWEEIPLLSDLLAPLADSCSRVQTFRVAGSGDHFDEQTEVVTLTPA